MAAAMAPGDGKTLVAVKRRKAVAATPADGEDDGLRRELRLGGSVAMIVGIVIVGMAGSALIPQASVVLVPLMVIGIPAVILLAMAAKAVLAVGLYEFATHKGGGNAFKPEELRAAFR